jgi:PAS domain S-box-containing protein
MSGSGQKVGALPDSFFPSVLDQMAVGVWVTGPDDVIVYVNPAMGRLAGVPCTTIVGVPVLTGFPEETIRDIRPIYLEAKRTLEPRPYHMVPVLTPSGRSTRQSGWFTPRVENGAYAGMIATVETASDLEGAEHAVMAWQERIQDFLRRTPAGYFRMDRSGRLTDVNDAWLKMYKYETREEVVGRHFADFQADADLAQAQAIVDQLVSGKAIPSGEFSRRCKDGSIGYFTFTAMPVLSRGEAVGLEGFLIDITERKRAEDALRASEQNLAITLNSIGDAVIATDPAGRVVRMNPVAEHLTGWSLAEAVGRPLDDVFRVINAFSRRSVESPVSRVLREKRVVGLANHSMLIARDGTERAIADSGAPIADEHGVIEGVVLVFRDVSQEYAAERERRIKESAIASSTSAILMTDLDGRLTYANRTALQCLGCESEAVLLGRCLDEFFPGAAGPGSPLAGLREGADWTGEAQVSGREGRKLEVFLTAGRVTDDQGTPLCLMVGFVDITARKQAEAALREREGRLAKLASQVQGMLYQFQQRPNGTYCVPYASEGIRDIFGVQPEAVREDIAPLLRAIHPDDVEGVIRSIARSAQDLSPWTYEFRVNLGGVGLRWMWGRSVPERLEDGGILWHGFITDVTERKQAEAALSASERRFRSLFDHMSEGVALHELVRDASGVVINYRILDVNPSYESQSGVSRENAVGRLATEAYGTPAPPYLQEFAGVAMTGKPYTFDVFFPPLARHFHISVVSPGPDQFATVFTDITERVALEESLRQARDQAEAANRAKSAFLATMSHELRTPLNPIIGFASLLMEDPGLAERQRRHLAIIRRRSEDLLALLSDILDFSRLEADRCALAPADVSVRDLLADVMRTLAPAAQEKSLWWEWHVAPETPDIIRVDPLRLKQALMNLLGNALKFTVSGGVSLVAGLSGDASARRISFAVTDTGPGIPPEERDRLFEPFVQGANASAQALGGAGLGLSIAQRLVVRMGGRLEVESDVGRGSTFRFTLPLVPPAGSSDDVASAVQATPPISNLGRGKRALVVDDDPSSWMLAASLLERAGFAVACAANGSDALRRFEEETYDLVLMDIRMPGMDGMAVTAKIRERHPDRRVAVVAMTAYAMPGDRERILSAGMDAYVVKPIRQADFYQAVSSVLDVSKAAE